MVEAIYFDHSSPQPPTSPSALANFLIAQQQERGVFPDEDAPGAAPAVTAADRGGLAHWATLSAREREG